jgi:general nucleoside transport system ATP-binding protein
MNVELRGITKRFPGVVANRDVDLLIHAGEVHALLGENGAGKTTLMNILFGLYRPDEGDILIDGTPVVCNDPKDAIAAGIGMVHQHFMLVPVFSVTENIMLGVEPVGPLGFLQRRAARARLLDLSTRYGLQVDPDATVEDLPVGVQQRAEILKALYRHASCLILDEPTAVLTPQETEDLFEVIRTLKAAGTSIVFISHKLKEVMEIADRITVLRLGAVVGTTTPAQASELMLATMMVGRDVRLEVAKEPSKPGETVLAVRDLEVLDDRGHRAVDGVSLQIRAGEILAIAGVQGNGQTELVEAITGMRPAVGGSIELSGQDVTNRSPRHLFKMGVAHVPEDRQKEGLIVSFPIRDNLVLNRYADPPYAQGIVVNNAAIDRSAADLVKEYDIRAPSPNVPCSTLSGGNQQKVIVAREFSRPSTLLVAAQPTRGLDVGSMEYIHQQIVVKRDEGTAVLIVSTELDEIMALGDRIAVLYQGKVMGVLDRADATRDDLGLLMAGRTPSAAPEPSREAEVVVER